MTKFLTHIEIFYNQSESYDIRPISPKEFQLNSLVHCTNNSDYKNFTI
jgi:hypothetical protein